MATSLFEPEVKIVNVNVYEIIVDSIDPEDLKTALDNFNIQIDRTQANPYIVSFRNFAQFIKDKNGVDVKEAILRSLRLLAASNLAFRINSRSLFMAAFKLALQENLSFQDKAEIQRVFVKLFKSEAES